MPLKEIAVLSPIIADYRESFYRILHKKLLDKDIRMTVFAGRPGRESGYRDVLGNLEFARHVETWRIGRRIYWQGGAAKFKEYDLLVLIQEVSALSLYPVLLSRGLFRRPRRVALWGHGRNFQIGEKKSRTDGLRRWMNGCADHVFAYTELSRMAFVARGADPDRITVVNNSKDTDTISLARTDMTARSRTKILGEVGLDANRPVAVFCSRLHEGKQLPFLVESARLIRERRPDFQLLIIGDGECRAWLARAVADAPWISLAGARHGRELANLLSAADIFLMPAHIGLSIVDAFSAGLPVVAAAFANHSPEVCYLEDGLNGLMAKPNVGDYASTVTALLENRNQRTLMAEQAILSAGRFSLPSMVDNFCDGVQRSLDGNRT